MIDLHLSAFAPRWRFLYAVRIDAYASLICEFCRRDAVYFMAKKITMSKHSGKTFEEVYAAFITAKTAKGVSDVTIRNYHQNLHNISLHFDRVCRKFCVNTEMRCK